MQRHELHIIALHALYTRRSDYEDMDIRYVLYNTNMQCKLVHSVLCIAMF